jgi:hypothetical protein
MSNDISTNQISFKTIKQLRDYNKEKKIEVCNRKKSFHEGVVALDSTLEDKFEDLRGEGTVLLSFPSATLSRSTFAALGSVSSFF